MEFGDSERLSEKGARQPYIDLQQAAETHAAEMGAVMLTDASMKFRHLVVYTKNQLP